MTAIADHVRSLLISANNVQILEVTTYEKLQEAWKRYLAEHHSFEAAVSRRLSDLARPKDTPWTKTQGGWSADASDLHLKPGVSPNDPAFVMPPGFPPRVPWDRLTDHGETYWVYPSPEATLTIYND